MVWNYVIESEVVNVNISKSDVIFQNNVSSRSHSRWVNPLILSHNCSGAIDSVENGGGEVNAATPRDPDCCGIQWEKSDSFRLICRYEHGSNNFCMYKTHFTAVTIKMD